MTTSPLWTPDRDRRAGSNLAAFAPRPRPAAGRLRRDPSLFRHANPRNSGRRCGTLPGSRHRRAGPRASKRRKCRRRPLLSRGAAQLCRKYAGRSDDDTPALVFRGEDKVRRTMSWSELNTSVARLHHALKAGLKPGDRVCAIVPNHAGNDRRLSRGRLRSAASGRPARPISASAASSTASARSRRASSSPATAITTTAKTIPLARQGRRRC